MEEGRGERKDVWWGCASILSLVGSIAWTGNWVRADGFEPLEGQYRADGFDTWAVLQGDGNLLLEYRKVTRLGIEPRPSGHIPDALTTELSSLVGFNHTMNFMLWS